MERFETDVFRQSNETVLSVVSKMYIYVPTIERRLLPTMGSLWLW